MRTSGHWPVPLFSLLLLASAQTAGAQALGGTARDAVTGAAIADAVITVLDRQGIEHGTVITDSAGTFHIPLPRAERYQLRAQHAAYAAHLSQFIRVRRGESIAVELRIGPEVTALAPLVVVARRRQPVNRLTEFYERMERQKKIAMGRFITRADIEQTSSIDVHTLLEREPSISIVRTAPPPVAVGGNGSGPPTQQDLLRAALNVRRTGVSEVITFTRRGVTGGGPCAPMIFLDGTPLGRAQYVQLTSFVSVDEIEGIEIYRSGMETPGELADGCGAIGVWTRRATGTSGNPFTWRRVAMAAGFVAAGAVVLSLLPD